MADIKVNAKEWESLSEKDRSEITSIMKEHGFLAGPDKIIGDQTSPSSEQVVKAAATHLASVARTHKGISTAAAVPAAFNFCKVGCDIAEAAAVAACALVPMPGNALCIAAAHAGAEFCRGKCK